MPLPWLDSTDTRFPDINLALSNPNGLLAAGGDLSARRLLQAYSSGIFPWYEEDQPILWWSPDPRMVLSPGDLRISKSLRKALRKSSYQVTMDTAFSEVMTRCAAPRGDSTETWITDKMRCAYAELHETGIAHSVEIWSEENLVGGLYGVALGQLFFGESMFSLQNNASKIALVALVKQLQQWNYKLIDCQVSSQHLVSLGASEISRETFKVKLRELLPETGKEGPWEFSLGSSDSRGEWSA